MPRKQSTGKSATPKSTTTRRPRRAKPEPGSRGLSVAEVAAEPTPEGAALAESIRDDGGAPLAVYREPLEGHTVVVATLPIDLVEPTPFQRDVSDAHVKKLVTAMERVHRYVDPIVAVRRDGRYWTPNGSHRLHALKSLGARAIVALVLPEEEVAFQILALNCEKAHNLKERSLEVIRMYRGLVGAKGGVERDYAALFEEPQFITFGAVYEKRPRYSAGAYSPVVRRIDAFLDESLGEALAVRESRADRLIELDDDVSGIIARLKEQGFDSPYLRNFVVARINPMRFTRATGTVQGDFDETLEKMLASAQRFDTGRVRREDIARMGGAPAEAEA